MSSFLNTYRLITFGIIVTIVKCKRQWWNLPQSSIKCVYNQPPQEELDIGFFGGPGGSQVWARYQGRVHSISWGISKEIIEYSIDHDAIANLKLQSDIQSVNVTLGTDPIDSCTPFTLSDGDHISGFRVIYREFVHGLHFHTRSGLTYKCVANLSYTTGLQDSGDRYINNSYLSGLKARTGGVIDAIGFYFTRCPYEPTLEPTTEPTTITLTSSVSNVNTNDSGQDYTQILLGLLISILSILIIYCLLKRYHMQKKSIHYVDKALVLIIGISEFKENDLETKYSSLPGVESNSKDLISLWNGTFNYEVFLCQNTHATKKGIIDFVNKHINKLINDRFRSYKAVLVHILSHGAAKKDAFITFDGQTMETSVIKSKVINAANRSNNRDLVKIIFYDACRGNADYSNRAIHYQRYNCISCICCCRSTINKKNNSIEEKYNDIDIKLRGNNATSNKANKSDPYPNCVTVYGTVEGRVVSDDHESNFTKCICDVFQRSIQNKCNMKQKCFSTLITEIGTNLWSSSNKSQICSSDGMITLKKKIIFRKMK
eukprot:238772_1